MSGLDVVLRIDRDGGGAPVLAAKLGAEPGQTVAVLGPNGAGKSTLLHAIAGLVPLAEGVVRIAGEVVEDVAAGIRVPPERRGIGVVFQDGRLLPHLRAVDDVAFGLRSRGATRREARRVAAAWLDRLGVGARATARPRELSGGEAQRVAIARALALRPRLLLLDEPFAAVDASARPALRRDVFGSLADAGAPRLLVTHDPVEALGLASRVVVVESGRVTHDAAPDELVARPRSAYVADLAGVNLLRGTAAAGVVTVRPGGTLVAAGAPDGEVLAVVHPRAVALHRSRPDGTPRNVWQARVGSADPEGDRVRVRLDGPVPLVAEVTGAAYAGLGLGPGSPVWVAVKATEVTAYPA